jgi:hypothetical protein
MLAARGDSRCRSLEHSPFAEGRQYDGVEYVPVRRRLIKMNRGELAAQPWSRQYAEYRSRVGLSRMTATNTPNRKGWRTTRGLSPTAPTRDMC